LVEYLRHKDTQFYPLKIEFESNFLTAIEKINETIEKLKELGYLLVKRNKYNSIMQLWSVVVFREFKRMQKIIS
jgi:hypothetical protein